MPFLAAISAGFTTSRVVLPGTGGGGGGGGGSFTWGGDRGIVAGGQSTGSNVIQYYDITTAGNAQDFGDLNYAPTRTAGLSNGTRAVIGGGFNGTTTYYDTMDYITVATTGNAQDLGDLSQARSSLAGASDATTGIFAGGGSNAVNFYLDTIDSFTIATTGNASDFGNLTQGRSLLAGWNNSTRAVFAGGDPDGATQSNVIDYITIASAGDATDFGDMTDSWNRASGAGDATYALFAGGRRAGSSNANGWTENIDYVTVATTGNATDFGDLTTFKDNTAGNSNGTRATFSGGSTNTGSNVTLNNIDYVTVATPGNATDFGDLLAVNESAAATSGSAGGGGGSSLWYGDRAIAGGEGGNVADSVNDICYFDITTTGNATNFGNLLQANEAGAQGSLSNATKALIAGGPRTSSRVSDIEQITVATAGNATDFGDLTEPLALTQGIHSGDKGFFVGGENNSGKVDVIQTVTVDTPGTASDFGDLTDVKYGNAVMTDNSRVVQAGGSSVTNDIEYWSNATAGNAQDFGDFNAMSNNESPNGASGSSGRGLIMGGTYSTYTTIEYITIASTGNATDFGDLALHPDGGGYGTYFAGAANNATRATKFGGIVSGGSQDIEYVEISTPGNSSDFGDLTRRITYTYGSSGSAS